MAAKFEVYKGTDGDFRWHLKAGNGEIIASGQGYKSKAAAEKGIKWVKTNAPYAAVVHEPEPTETPHGIALRRQQRLKNMAPKFKLKLKP